MPPKEGQEEPLRRLAKLVQSFMSRPDAQPFLEPVDWRGLDLYDYPEIIQKMMDLGTIKRKLDRKQYNTAWECAQDIKLVWSNCMLYNTEGSELWMIAKSFNRKFEDKFRRIRQEFDIGEEQEQAEGAGAGEGGDEEEEEEKDSEEEEQDERDFADNMDSSVEGSKAPTSGPSLDARSQLASNLLLLNGMELGHIMSILEQESPKALLPLPTNDDDDGQKYGPIIPEKLEIDLDALDGTVFQKISQYAAERASERKKGMTAAGVGGGDAEVHLEDVSGKRKRKR